MMRAREKTEKKVEVGSEREREDHNNLLFFQYIIRIIFKKWRGRGTEDGKERRLAVHDDNKIL
jgi:hypothetical protein